MSPELWIYGTPLDTSNLEPMYGRIPSCLFPYMYRVRLKAVLCLVYATDRFPQVFVHGINCFMKDDEINYRRKEKNRITVLYHTIRMALAIIEYKIKITKEDRKSVV